MLDKELFSVSKNLVNFVICKAENMKFSGVNNIQSYAEGYRNAILNLYNSYEFQELIEYTKNNKHKY